MAYMIDEISLAQIDGNLVFKHRQKINSSEHWIITLNQAYFGIG